MVGGEGREHREHREGGEARRNCKEGGRGAGVRGESCRVGRKGGAVGVRLAGRASSGEMVQI
jgi:hypothetical protein